MELATNNNDWSSSWKAQHDWPLLKRPDTGRILHVLWGSAMILTTQCTTGLSWALMRFSKAFSRCSDRFSWPWRFPQRHVHGPGPHKAVEIVRGSRERSQELRNCPEMWPPATAPEALSVKLLAPCRCTSHVWTYEPPCREVLNFGSSSSENKLHLRSPRILQVRSTDPSNKDPKMTAHCQAIHDLPVPAES